MIGIHLTGDPVACEPAPEATGSSAALVFFEKAFCSRRRVKDKKPSAPRKRSLPVLGILVTSNLTTFALAPTQSRRRCHAVPPKAFCSQLRSNSEKRFGKLDSLFAGVR